MPLLSIHAIVTPDHPGAGQLLGERLELHGFPGDLLNLYHLS